MNTHAHHNRDDYKRGSQVVPEIVKGMFLRYGF